MIARFVIVAVFFTATAFAAVDHNPKSTGSTAARNTLGRSFEAAYHNPALLGMDKRPVGGALLAPLTNYGVGYWSDKLALSPFRKYWASSWAERTDLVKAIMYNSFDLDGLNPDQVSQRLMDDLTGGFKLYMGGRASLLSIAHKYFAFDVTTHFDEEIHIPEGPVYILLNGPDRLRRGGKALDFSDFRQEAIWSTDFAFDVGLPLTIPALHNLFHLRYGAGGVGIKYIMGHSLLKATTRNGSLRYDSLSGENLVVDGEVLIQTAGTGLHGNFESGNPFPNGLPVNGHGIGVDVGGILYDDKGTLSINIKDLGVLFWMKDTRETTHKIQKSDFDFYDVVKGIQQTDEPGETRDANTLIFGNKITGAADSLKTSTGFVTVLPLALHIGYGREWDLTGEFRPAIGRFASYAQAGVDYEQHLTSGPGLSYIPRISLGGSLGLLQGFFPIRTGFVFGGAEKIASALGASFDFSYFSLNASYKAIGSPVFIPRRGVEIAFGANMNWGMYPDADRDGIPDRTDDCPHDAEDSDGFQDQDGCPDPDNDADGIPDLRDRCPNIPEDMDDIDDDDGCPDGDDDHDGINDSVDACPKEAEDRDGFQDNDGCPEFDNDKDGIADTVDKCPNDAEDRDFFEDRDGCPDYDNDGDRIPDSLDRCPTEPEMYNGMDDADGCPDSLKKPTVQEEKKLRKELEGVLFNTGTAELTTESYNHLNFIVTLVRQYSYLRYEIQGHTDSRGDDAYNLILSAARAKAVRDYLIERGFPAENIIAIGYGETKPIGSNNTAAGRTLNRRVEFHIIDTDDQYNALRMREGEFEDELRRAKIKGSGY